MTTERCNFAPMYITATPRSGRKRSVCFQRFQEESKRVHERRPDEKRPYGFRDGIFMKSRQDVINPRTLCRPQPLPIGANPLRRHTLYNEPGLSGLVARKLL